jgi:hypothetical protein
MNGLPVLTGAELASKELLDPVTISYVPPKKYPTGALTFEHTFPEIEKFVGIVTVENDHGQKYVSQFPFSVGQPFGKSMKLYIATVGLLASGVYGIWYFGGKQKKPAIPKARSEELRHGRR